MEQNLKRVQRIQIPDSLETYGEPGVLSLYGIMAKLLCNPKGYHAPHGGVKAQLRRMHRTGSVFTPAWKLLIANYLKLVRVPVADDRFVTFYELYKEPRRDIPAERFLNARDGRAYAAAYQPYLEPDKDPDYSGGFIMTSAEMLTSRMLSPRAKGLIVLLEREIQLALYSPATKPAATKSSMLAENRMSHARINNAWREALRCGWIQQSRVVDERIGKLSWAYRISSSADEAVKVAAEREALLLRRRDTGSRWTLDADKNARVAQTRAEQDGIKRLLRENIGYTELAERYSRRDLDRLVRAMAAAVCSPRPTLFVSGAVRPTQMIREMLLDVRCVTVRSVLDNLSRRGMSVGGVSRQYLLAALYNAAAAGRGLPVLQACRDAVQDFRSHMDALRV